MPDTSSGNEIMKLKFLRTHPSMNLIGLLCVDGFVLLDTKCKHLQPTSNKLIGELQYAYGCYEFLVAKKIEIEAITYMLREN